MLNDDWLEEHVDSSEAKEFCFKIQVMFLQKLMASYLSQFTFHNFCHSLTLAIQPPLAVSENLFLTALLL